MAVFKPPEPDTQKPRPVGLGRVTEWRIRAYEEPRPGAKKAYALIRDDVLDIYDEFNYDLPGVPFCTDFTQSAAAMHGAFWRNDFGHPRSHGRVNVLAEDAR